MDVGRGGTGYSSSRVSVTTGARCSVDFGAADIGGHVTGKTRLDEIDQKWRREAGL